MQLPFFVYGTLKPGDSNYDQYLAGRTIEERPAVLSAAAIYDYGPYPFLTDAPGLAQSSDRVYGVLITLQPELYDTTLIELDSLESYDTATQQGVYLRVIRVVQTNDGPAKAWVYIAGAEMVAAIGSGQLPKIEDGVWASSYH